MVLQERIRILYKQAKAYEGHQKIVEKRAL